MPASLAFTLAVVLSGLGSRGAVTLQGRVVDARTAQPVPFAHVRVSAGRRETTSGPDGRFAIAGLLAGGLQLRVSAPGYREFVVRMALGEAPAEFPVALEPEPPRITESVTVTPAPSPDSRDPPGPLARSHDAEEIKNLASVVASDPLRAVQALPGVAANDEFNAGFAARGSGFSAAGLYIDGVRLGAPFHTVRDVNDGYTLTIFNADVLDSVSLMPGAAPARYGDRVGAVLAVRTREGRTDSFHGRASIGAAGAYATLEGPIGRSKKAAWLVSARKSYLDYIIERVDDRPQLALGYYDLTTRATLHPTPTQTIALLGLLGRARYRNTKKAPDAHEMLTAAAGTDLLHLSWQAATSSSLSFAATGFLLRETGDNRDADAFQRYSSEAWSAGLQSEAAWRLGSWRVEGGVEARRVNEDVLSRRFDTSLQAPRVLEDYHRGGWLSGFFAQATWAKPGGRLVLTGGGRLDHLDATGQTVVVPRASLELGLTATTRLVAAVGGYAQLPSFARLAGENGNPYLQAERSRHLVLAIDQRLARSLRVHVEAYDQRESDVIFNRELEYRVEGGHLVRPQPGALLLNALDGPSRGIETTIATTGGGRLGGFVSYAWAHARRTDPSGLRFDSDFDQRHTLTGFLRARASASVVLSTAFRYGSGFPLPGFLRQAADGVFVDSQRNRFGPGSYARWDLRGEKRFVWRRAALELFLEIANVLDRDNVRYNEVSSVDVETGRARIDRDNLMPRLPLFGLSVEF